MPTINEDKKVIEKFEQDVAKFFVQGAEGILWPYVYGAPKTDSDPVRGGILYNEMLEGEPDYYLYKYEAELFQTKGELLTNQIGSGATFIELGPGSEQSLRLKTLPLLGFCESLKGYFGIDISQSFLDKGLAVIRSEFPQILIDGTQQDFTQLKELPNFERSVIFFKGSTIANLTKQEMPVFIESISKLAHEDHYLLLVHDCNQDETSLMNAYDTPKMGVLIENIMYRAARDSGAIGMKPEAFRYAPEWDVENHDLKHVLVATQAQEFTLQGETVTIEENQKFHTLSSFKYPVDVFQSVICSTGYRSIDVVFDDSGRMAAHLFQK